jgi:hypothetical protein
MQIINKDKASSISDIMYKQYGKSTMSHEQYRDFLDTLHDTCPPERITPDPQPTTSLKKTDTSGAVQPVQREGAMSRLLKRIDTEKNKPDWLRPGI